MKSLGIIGIKKSKMMKNTRNIILIFIGMILLLACATDDHKTENRPIAAGVYSSDILLATEKSGEPEVSTRGLDSVNGFFTDVYPYDYIYIHSADDKTNEEGHKYLKIPLQDVIFCDGCQGIHLEMEVLDESEGGGYIIKNKARESIKLGADEKVYFSTIESSYWEANVVGATPVSGSDVFIQDNNVNKELLRSAYEYSKEDLISLLSESEPDIPMMRHCTAFRVYVMFTNVMADNMGSIDETGWDTALGEDYGIENFYIKLYLGPNFTEEYNVYADDVTNPDSKGFYATNQQKYQPLEFAEYGTTSGTGGMIMFNGYGYMTDLGNHLIAPLNTNIPAEDFSVYAFVKYAPDPDNLPDDFLTSDEGAKWFKLQVPSMTLEANRVHWVIMSVDVHNLEVFKESQNKTRATNAPEEIKVNYKAFNIEE